MKRKIFEQLKAWKADRYRKPLILMGARQVGKTYILERFGEVEYTSSVYLNFEDHPSLKSLFEFSLNPYEIIKTLEIETGKKIHPNQTLIIFDEIQECPQALNSLKYFYEEANEFHVCAAGSLLGVKLINTKGFPVGKVNFLDLYPLCFSEFLQALGEDELQNYIKGITRIEPIPLLLHEKLMRYFKIYLFTGGMPEVVAKYILDETIFNVRSTQNEILKAYSLDFSKHAPKDQIMRITQVWDSIPGQLAKENKKFIYSMLRKGARAKDFEIAIQWLTEARLIYKIYNITTSKLPLTAYKEFDFFKIYFLDVGLLGAMANLSEKILNQGNQLFQEFRGSFIENYVAQELTRLHYNLYYWTSAGKAELDFIIQHENEIYPIEVKSGNSGHKKSLKVYEEKYNPPLMIRYSPMNLKKDGLVINIPLYLTGETKRLLDIANF